MHPSAAGVCQNPPRNAPGPAAHLSLAPGSPLCGRWSTCPEHPNAVKPTLRRRRHYLFGGYMTHFGPTMAMAGPFRRLLCCQQGTGLQGDSRRALRCLVDAFEAGRAFARGWGGGAWGRGGGARLAHTAQVEAGIPRVWLSLIHLPRNGGCVLPEAFNACPDGAAGL